MKKLICVLCASLLLIIGAASCSKSVSKADKEALEQKIKSGQELDQSDYALMIDIIKDDVEWVKSKKDAKKEDLSEADQQKGMEVLGEILGLGIALDEAAKTDKLDKSNLSNYQKLDKELSAMDKD